MFLDKNWELIFTIEICQWQSLPLINIIIIIIIIITITNKYYYY